MESRDLVRKYTFSKEERDRLRDIEAGITISNVQIDGMQIYKNGILSTVYKRLGIDGEAKKGFTKSIQYNLGINEIIHTESPEKPKIELAKK